MSSRDEIFSRIRKALPPEEERPKRPEFVNGDLLSRPRLEGSSLWDTFKRNFEAVNGRAMESVGALADFLLEREFSTGYCDPRLMDRVGSPLAERGLQVETVFERSRYDDYQFGITRATGAIAESGSLIFDDESTSDRLAALSPWVHVGLLERHELIRSIPEAVDRFGASSNIVWATGPSKTADVEGILIEGVHGPGEEIALLLE
ncbi:MAG: LUD domain-containing protein [Akkermansiaceae bacterium]|nr:LUD domain-containing protein [Akkermansiaceae bacterium]NNM30929.1 LUD domain-containing protein [Akkermansiaceae bacterium]